MNSLLHRLKLFVILVLIQALVLNFVQLFGCATPLLYIYMLLQLPRGIVKWQLYLWGFCLGLTIDIFQNTPGVATIACTTMAAARPLILEPFLTVDVAEDVEPSLRQMSLQKYLSYAGVFTLCYCILFYSIDYFTLWHFGKWLLSIISSFILTMLTISAVALAFQKK